MNKTRRAFLADSAKVLAAAALVSDVKAAFAEAGASGVKVSMYDGSLGYRADIRAIERAHKIGLDGVQVNFCSNASPFRPIVRDPEMQKRYLAESRKYGIAINSIALGILNHVPLKSEPRAALWMLDAIEAARTLGAHNVMPACFVRGEIDPDNETEMRRVTEVLEELAPRAEKAGIIIGLESTLSAEEHLQILDQVKSRFVQVYYDVFNMVKKKRDPVREIKLLGKERICEIHFKQAYTYLSHGGPVDWKGVAEALGEIGYEGWATLETANPSKDVIADTKRNAAFVWELLSGLQ